MDYDYGKLKAGLHLVKGDNVKSLSLGSASGWGDAFLTGDSVSGGGLNALAANVAWLYIARDKRRDQVIQTPMKWFKGDKELEPDESPFGFDEMELSRVDWGLKLHNNAYYHRANGRGAKRGKTTSLAWLNPECVQPYKNEIPNLHTGYTKYQYTGSAVKINGQMGGAIPADELLRFELPGMTELWSGNGAGRASRLAAKVLAAVDELNATQLGDDSAMPVYLVNIPEKYKGESEKVAGRLRSLFNRSSGMFGRNKTAGVPEGVTVQKLSLTPAELNLSETESTKYKSVLAAYGVPLSHVDQASNFATKKSYDISFALSVAYNIKWIASIINKDEAFKRDGYRLVVEPEKLAINLEEEQRRSEMAATFHLMGESRENAYLLAGIKIPEEYKAVIEPEPVAVQPAPPSQLEQQVNEMPLFDNEVKSLQEFNKRPRGRSFKSDVLTEFEIKALSGEMI